jgi:hypothetical protein
MYLYLTDLSPILDIGKWVYATSQSGTSTFTVPAGITRIKVTITGGGGAGGDGGGGPTPSGGGSAGGTSIKWYDVSATTTIQYHVGAANGDGSWFGGSFASPVMVANAGIKPTGAARGPDGGTATGGDINIVGGAGSSPGTAAGTTGGTGGASIWGGGGAAGNNTTASGNSTLVCGAGGGGGYTSTGGSGAAGCLIIEY